MFRVVYTYEICKKKALKTSGWFLTKGRTLLQLYWNQILHNDNDMNKLVRKNPSTEVNA